MANPNVLGIAGLGASFDTFCSRVSLTSSARLVVEARNWRNIWVMSSRAVDEDDVEGEKEEEEEEAEGDEEGKRRILANSNTTRILQSINETPRSVVSSSRPLWAFFLCVYAELRRPSCLVPR